MRLFLLSALLGISLPSSAKMMMPPEMPVERVITNLSKRLEQNPKDANAHYLLGRTYYSIYCGTDPRFLRFYGTPEDPHFPSAQPSFHEFHKLEPKRDSKTVNTVRKAIHHLKAANNLGGGELGLYPLTLACVYEASQRIASFVQPGATTAIFRQRALSFYQRSFLAARDDKHETAQRPMTYEKWISVEAGDAILRLDPKSSMKPAIQERLAQLAKLPGGPITPIIFSLTHDFGLAALLEPAKRVRFDLDGTGTKQTVQWVKPETAFLVWLPDASKPITSGRQLFGSATWWLMPTDGYAALSLLDDNQNEWIEGREMSGLAIWQDKNQDGKSSLAEIRRLPDAGIEGLRVRSTGKIGDSLVSASGLRLSNGQTLPTYDWVL